MREAIEDAMIGALIDGVKFVAVLILSVGFVIVLPILAVSCENSILGGGLFGLWVVGMFVFAVVDGREVLR